MPLSPGAAFGAYRIVEVIGKGGMATVYAAQDEVLDRRVALKVLPPELLHDDTFAERFRREVRLMAALEHPAIVPVYAAGIEQGLPWMALRLVQGGTLAQLLQACNEGQATLGPERAVRVVEAVAAALDHAHAAGVVHRDVKPQNVLLDGAGRAYLADFGVARLARGAPELTRTGHVIGTPHYMAPEQALSRAVDARCDVYALGVVAWHMLSGQVPFDGDTPLVVMMRHLQEPLPAAALDPALRAPLERALAKQPEARWASAGDFAAALRAALADAVTATAPVAFRAPAEDDLTRTRQRLVVRPPAPPLHRVAFTWVRVDGAGQVVARQRGRGRAFELRLPGGPPMEFVEVPSGRLELGSPDDEPGRDADEGPRRTVHVPGFFLARRTVTRAHWSAVARLPAVERALVAIPGRARHADLPVVQVSWLEALEFCRRLSALAGLPVRLPSEAEWEHAARAGTTTPFHFGPVLPETLACFDRGPRATPWTGWGKPANPFGVLDVHGNVWELCQDTWHPGHAGGPGDGSAWETPEHDARRVMRGGAWCDAARHCRSASRYRMEPEERNDATGFRVLCDVGA